MKDSGIEWIGEIPIDWKILRIKELFAEVNERAVDNSLQLLSVSEYYGVAPKSEKIEEGDFLTHAESLDGYKICKPDDIVMNIMLAWKRALGVSRYDGIISPAYCVFRKRNEDVWPYYFHYLFRTQKYANLFKQYSTGIIDSRLRLYPDKFLALKCQVPPVKEQERMVKYLDSKCSLIDSIIAKQEQIIEKLKEYRLSIITEAVTKGLDPTVEMKNSGVEWMGEVPVAWKLMKLKYASEMMRGRFNHRPRNDPEFYDGEFPFVQTGEVARAPKYITSYSQTLNEKGYSVSKEFPKGCICMTIAANVGDVAILDFDACFPDSIVGFNPTDKTDGNYLFYVLSAMKQQFMRNAIISTQLNLNIEIIKEEFIPIAPYEVQMKIGSFLDKKSESINAEIERRKTIITKLLVYKKSLIYEVVTGKKEV